MNWFFLRWVTKAVLVVLTLAELGCGGCGSGAPLATLLRSAGRVQRVEAPAPDWRGASVGDQFRLGDAVRTRSDATAGLGLADGAEVSLQPDTTIRFMSEHPGETREASLVVETGSAIVQSGSEAVSVRTPAGVARLEAGSRLLMTRGDDGVGYEVLVGRAVIGVHVLEVSSPPLVHSGDEAPPAPEAAPAAEKSPVPAVAAPRPITPTVVKAKAASPGAVRDGAEGWVALPVGVTPLPAETRVRLAKDVRVAIEREGQRAHLTATGAYAVAPSPDTLLSVRSGSVRIEDSSAVRVAVPNGVVEFPAGAVAVIRVDERGARVEVLAKSATLRGQGRARKVEPGQGAALRGQEWKLQGVGLGRADVDVVAGESLSLHDPAPPTAVRFGLREACPYRGVVRVKHKGRRQFASGRRAVALSLAAGIHRYTLDCIDKDGKLRRAAAKGRIRVVKDQARRSVSRTPPSATLQADGRSYTVLYQDKLPAVTLKWSGAVGGPAAVLHEFEGHRTQYAAPSNEYTFESGVLQPGEHTVVFQSGARASRPTRVRVRFDGDGPVAQLGTLGAANGGGQELVGRVQPGWRVQVGGHTVPVSAEGRFAVTAPAQASGPLPVRLTHKNRGTRIYLSRGAR